MTARYRLIWMLALVFCAWLATASLGRAQTVLFPSTADTLLSIGTPSPAPVVVVTPPPTIVVAPSTSSSSPSTTTICTTAGSITYCTH